MVKNSTGDIKVHSSGYDQRFKTWNLAWSDEEHGLVLSKEQFKHHGLSDMNGMCKSGRTVYLFGLGI